jgi:Ca2+-binding EF-hand superfamily protein
MKLFIVNIFNRNILWHFSGKTHFTKDEFIKLIRFTLNFIDIGRVQDILLFRLFDRIDTNKDGLISVDEYNRWFTNFLAVLSYYDS